MILFHMMATELPQSEKLSVNSLSTDVRMSEWNILKKRLSIPYPIPVKHQVEDQK